GAAGEDSGETAERRESRPRSSRARGARKSETAHTPIPRRPRGRKYARKSSMASASRHPNTRSGRTDPTAERPTVVCAVANLLKSHGRAYHRQAAHLPTEPR